MDSKMQASQRAIGASSDVAQLALSYYFDRTYKGIYDEVTKQLYENIIVLACLAQISIDGAKRQYSIDPVEEIKRIRKLPCMKKDKDYPRFIEYAKPVPMTKNGIQRDYEDIIKDKDKQRSRIDDSIVCPMNWVEECLDQIQNTPLSKTIPTSEFFAWEKGSANPRHMGKIRKIVEEYSEWLMNHGNLIIDGDKETFESYYSNTEEVIEKIKGIKISKITMNHLIGSCLGVEGRINKRSMYKKASKYTRNMLGLLYRSNKDMFLSCWRS